MKNRRGRIDIGRIIMTALMIAGGYALYAFVPHQWRFMNFEEAVSEAAYYWRDNRNRDKTMRRFWRELEIRNLHNDFTGDECEFFEDYSDKSKNIRCYYIIEVEVPLVGTRYLEFFTHQYVATDGYLYAIDQDGNPL